MRAVVEHLFQLGALTILNRPLNWFRHDKKPAAFELVVIGVHVPESYHCIIFRAMIRAISHVLLCVLANICVVSWTHALKFFGDLMQVVFLV